MSAQDVKIHTIRGFTLQDVDFDAIVTRLGHVRTVFTDGALSTDIIQNIVVDEESSD